ncbi:MAG: DUF2029 domain-containing protein [Clostridia bacterium]|nr:DUF2029 domain-containing protein [Clostridia bacterium]
MKKFSLKPDPDKVYYRQVFFFAMTVLCLSFFVVLLFSGGYSMRGLLASDINGSFMEFFGNLFHSGGNTYASGAVTAPFAILFYRGLFAFLPSGLTSQIVPSLSSATVPVEVKTYQQFYFPFILYTFLVILLMFFSLRAIKAGGKIEKIAFVTLIFLSGPVIFAFERGSDMPVTLALLVFFFFLKDSEKKVMRNIGVAALGFACAFSIYPLLFLIVLLRKKRFWDAGKALIVFTVLTVPAIFLVCGGLQGLGVYASNLVTAWKENNLTLLGQLNFPKCLINILADAEVSGETLVTAGNVFGLVIGLPALIGACLAKKEWQQTALICALIFGLSPVCETTLLMFFALPLVQLIDGENKNSPVSYVSLGFITVALAPLVSPDVTSRSYTRMFYTRVTSYGVLVLAAMLTIVAAVDFIKGLGKKAPVEESAAQKETSVLPSVQ